MSTAPPGAAPTATVRPPKPLRIKTLTLTDCRAFPGPAPQAIEFGGKNLLVYGENSAGKSSIFHALRALFSEAPPSKDGFLAAYKNKRTTNTATVRSTCGVAVRGCRRGGWRRAKQDWHGPPVLIDDAMGTHSAAKGLP